ncbi:poly [ADP-ribose] polymerase tankyrase-2-like [Oncorhynchus keta]|uniref:poly [ADP-ribose] polymerase tankyrase-2-like n=1 Tax=Oncorhynchus keta TaxID=8018 RepID=UPI0015F84648|nr:poly [ADP-ribose] polymerase tankyrase-2-like [Oncorhynchus keta]
MFKKNCDGNMSLDMVKEGDTGIQDKLEGDAALLEHRADDNAQVKGGSPPCATQPDIHQALEDVLHAHMHIAALLIKCHVRMNATDK